MKQPDIAVVVPAYNEERTLISTLDALYNQSDRDFLPIVVNNASTDGTAALLHSYQRVRPDFPLVVIDEDRKGTGVACNTGFEAAIEAGAAHIARTDADTLPRRDWIKQIRGRLDRDPQIELVSGITTPKRDEWYRPGDELLLSASNGLARLLNSYRWRSRGGLKFAIGHNMATTAKAFEATGGFPNTSIAETDEDADYSRSIDILFGPDALAFEPKMVVYTSMRRARVVGKHGLRYYSKNVTPEYRNAACGGSVDIR